MAQLEQPIRLAESRLPTPKSATNWTLARRGAALLSMALLTSGRPLALPLDRSRLEFSELVQHALPIG
jgi:hypothetical protein